MRDANGLTVMVAVDDLSGDLDQLALYSPEKVEPQMATLAADGQLQPIGIVDGTKRIIKRRRSSMRPDPQRPSARLRCASGY